MQPWHLVHGRAGHRVFTTPYANVYTLAIELATIENPNDDQLCLKVILQVAKGASATPNPSRGLDLGPPTNS
jgi:hypothetical protein